MIIKSEEFIDSILYKDAFEEFLAKETNLSNTEIINYSDSIYKKKKLMKLKDIIIYLMGII